MAFYLQNAFRDFGQPGFTLQCDEFVFQLVTLQHIDNQHVKDKCDE